MHNLLCSGIVRSMKWWLNSMSSTGAHAAAVAAMLKEDYPSFGYMMASNATTAWEVWSFSDNTYRSGVRATSYGLIV